MRLLRFILPLLLVALFQLSAFAQEGYQGLCWEISGNGLKKSSYLYGTMHTADNRAFQFQDGVLDAFKKTKIYAMELNMNEMNYFSLFNLLMMDSAKSLDDVLPADDYETVKVYFEDSLGLGSFKLLHRMQPYFLSIMIPQKVLKADREHPLDMYFNNLAKKQRKKIYGLETFEEQIGAFNTIPYESQAESLLEAIESRNEPDTLTQQMIEYYAEGDLDKLLDITKSSDMSFDFYKVFIVDRNINMADRLEQYIIKKRTFIAVGAAHLPGPDGVIELLRAKGYTVKPFESK